MISKSAAKLQQIFDIRKELHKKNAPEMRFPYLEDLREQIEVLPYRIKCIAWRGS